MKDETQFDQWMTLKLINYTQRTERMDSRVLILDCAEVVIHVLHFWSTGYILFLHMRRVGFRQ